jgi:hypothetical protein
MGGSTQCGSWDFESSTGEGWQPVPTQIGTASDFQVKAAPGGSLAFSFKMNNTGATESTTIRVPLCNGQGTTATSHWLTAQIYADGPPFIYQSNMENSGAFSWEDPSGSYLGGSQFILLYPEKSWVTVGDSSLSNILSDGALGSISLNVHVETGWVGTIYVDNIQFH